MVGSLEYINNVNVYVKNKFKCAILRYNAYCYIVIQIYNNEYNVLYDNFSNTWKCINNKALSYTAEQKLSLYDSDITNDKFIARFKNLNIITEHPLKINIH